VNSARDQARGIPGVDRLQSDSLKDRGPAATLPVVGEIERTRLLFDIGAEEPLPASLAEIAAIAARVRAIQRAAGAMGLAVEVAIAGSTDGVGKSETNAALSRRRAERVRALLAGAGVAPAWMIAGGAPVATAADAPQAELRRVSFTVSFSPLP
jgi:outer membrane protein OmpA-like peptidoglycan-associated protein